MQMNWKKETDGIARRRELAFEKGGADAIAKHNSKERLTIRERIEKLLDPGSFEEVCPSAGAALGAVAGLPAGRRVASHFSVMSKRRSCFLLFFVFFFGSNSLFSKENNHSTSIALIENDSHLIVTNQESNSISIINVQQGYEKIGEIPVGSRPQTAAFDNLHKNIFVSNQNEGTLSIINFDSLSNAGCLETNLAPFGVVVGEHLIFVSNQESHNVTVYDKSNFIRLKTINTEKFPRGLNLYAEKDRLYVTHFKNGKLTVINTNTLEIDSVINMGSNASLFQSVTITDDGKYGYLPQTFSNTTNTSLQFDSTVFPSVSVVDLENGANLRKKRIGLDIVDRPVGMPLESALNSSGDLYIVNSASDDISVVNLNNIDAVAHIEVGRNPKGIALSHSQQRAYIDNALDGTVSVIDIETNLEIETFEATLLEENARLLNGRRIFNSSSRSDLSRDQWVACSTCHFDGGNDGNSWFFADGLRNTPSLFGVSETPPFHWSGNLDELQDVEMTIRDLQGGTGLAIGESNCSPSCDQGAPNKFRSEDLDDLALYITSLKFPSSARLGSIPQNSPYKKGEALFSDEKTRCASCHYPPLYSDGLKHNLSSTTDNIANLFDTPSLRGLANSAPYFHNGSATTLEDVLQLSTLNDRHGSVSHLSTLQKQNLLTFLKKIPIAETSIEPEETQSCLPPSQVFGITKKMAYSDLELNSAYFRAGGRFNLTLESSSNTPTTTYVAIVPPSGDFHTISTDGSLSDLNSITSYEISFSPKEQNRKTIANTTVPNGLKPGDYRILVVTVGIDKEVTNPENWLSFDEVVFEIRSYL
jgi:YVTN family beta-propeller protein